MWQAALLLSVACTVSYTTRLQVDSPGQCLQQHNMLRQLHQNTPNLQWDESLEVAAQDYAQQLVVLGSLKHDVRNRDMGWGENLYYSYSSSKALCVNAIYSWYTEINDYSFSSGRTTNGKAVGHFTQLVWDDTTHVGMGIATKQSGSYWITYIVAKYSPPGNYRGQYTSHVHRLKPGAQIPRIHQLDPRLCTNSDKCDLYFKFGYNCNHSTIKSMCYKRCEGC